MAELQRRRNLHVHRAYRIFSVGRLLPQHVPQRRTVSIWSPWNAIYEASIIQHQKERTAIYSPAAPPPPPV